MRRFLLLLALAGAPAAVFAASDPPTRLLVTVVVDGLSTRQLERHREVLNAGGFRRLLEDGAWFRRASFAHGATWTGAGHGTIATGTSPRDHGLVANSWFDRGAGRRVYCVEDSESRILGGATEKRGASARNLLVPTVADLLWERSRGRSRTLAVSLKDRGAVTGAGRHGLAFWFDNASGRFQTADVFARELPAWWKSYYEGSPQDRFVGAVRAPAPTPQAWHAAYGDALATLRAREIRIQDFTRLPDVASPEYYRALKSSPHGDTLLLEFVRAAMSHGDLGRLADRTDQLFVSFSAHDYVSHDVGNDSPVASAVVENLDRDISGLLDDLDREIGANRWTLAFTADHGYPDTPEVVQRSGRDAGRLDPKALGEGLDAHLDARFSAHDWILQWRVPTFYLAIPPEMDGVEVWTEAQSWLLGQPGILRVFRRDELIADTMQDPLFAAARESFHPERSGDLFLVQKPNWYLLYDPRADVCTHGSAWDYDREVPLIFLGRGVRSGVYEDEAHIRDLAPTLLALAGQAPAGFMTGRVLRAAIR